jgi:hypothetical protein
VPHIIAWCGFLGAWLLVAGPLDQAVREVEENEFERALIVVMLAFCVDTTRLRYQHRQARPAIED